MVTDIFSQALLCCRPIFLVCDTNTIDIYPCESIANLLVVSCWADNLVKF